MNSPHLPLRTSGTLLALFSAFLWGGTGVANQFAVDDVPPLLVGAIRFVMAAVFMLAWCRWEGAPLGLTRSQWRPVFWMSVLLVGQIGAFNIGGKLSTASHASLFVNTYVFWVAAGEHFWLRSIALRPRQVLGLLIAAAGVVLLLATSGKPGGTSVTVGPALDQPTLLGDAVLMLSGLLLGVKVVYTKTVVRTIPPGTLILWHDILGAAMFLALSLAFEPIPDRAPGLPAWWALLYSGFVVSGFCFAANAWQLKRHGASQISVFSFTTPIFGVALGVLLRGDELSSWLLASGAAVALGITLVNLKEGSPAEAPE
ncbi:MAG: DMT family transporter [Planctomyces sp.]|nr:DMT family transporter [Planctomyces sp.]